MPTISMREQTLDEADSFALAAFSDPLGTFQIGPPVLRRVHATYYDTVDLRLLRWGASLSFRADDTWLLELGDPSAAAPERRTFPGIAGGIPAAALDLVSVLRHKKPLRVVADLRIVETWRAVSMPDHGPVADLVEDDVRVIRGRAVAGRFRQLRLQLRPEAPAAILQGLRARLNDVGAGRDGASARLAMALGIDIGPELVVFSLTAQSCIGETVLAVLARSVTELIRLDPHLRVGPAAHDMYRARDLVRRLRAELRLFLPLLERRDVARLDARLAWFELCLSRALDECVPESRRAAFAALTAAVHGKRYRKLLDRLVRIASHPRVRKPRRLASRILPRLMKRVWKRTRKAVRRAASRPGSRALENVRVATRDLRAAAGACAAVAGHDARRFAKRAAQLPACFDDGVANEWIAIWKRLERNRWRRSW